MLAALPLGSSWGAAAPATHDEGTPPYLNPAVPAAQRAADLIARMTLPEKLSQLNNDARAIPRLKVPGYNYWNEALDRKSTRLNSSHLARSRMPSSA